MIISIESIKTYLYKVLDGQRNVNMVNNDALWKWYDEAIYHLCKWQSSCAPVRKSALGSVYFIPLLELWSILHGNQ